MGKNRLIILLIIAILLILGAGSALLGHLLGGGQNGGTGSHNGRFLVQEEFDEAMDAVDGQSFGDKGRLTFELFRNGTFVIDGQSGLAWQKSASYRDAAIIRTTDPLPKTYKISVLLGEIDYDLDHIKGLANDPEYTEGPRNENGCYLIAITDEVPTGHYRNDWWHQHRKVVMDVDNNVWGHGMPNPIFMVYFDRSNRLMSFDGRYDEWQQDWEQGVEYEKQQWYRVDLEKTNTHFIFSISDEQGNLLKNAATELENVWHADRNYPDYFVIGDPHENYYQGSFKIKSVTITY